jgi:oligosaccharide reducing-end xylanase
VSQARDESYVEDTYNNDVRTEGMSYGMIVAVELDHQKVSTGGPEC